MSSTAGKAPLVSYTSTEMTSCEANLRGGEVIGSLLIAAGRQWPTGSQRIRRSAVPCRTVGPAPPDRTSSGSDRRRFPEGGAAALQPPAADHPVFCVDVIWCERR